MAALATQGYKSVLMVTFQEFQRLMHALFVFLMEKIIRPMAHVVQETQHTAAYYVRLITGVLFILLYGPYLVGVVLRKLREK